MLEKRLLEELLGIAVSTGADFAEVFAEQERSGQLRLISGKIESVRDNLLSGVGIRAFVGTKTYYASTSDTSRAGLLRCAAAVAGAVGDENGQATSINLTPDAITVERIAHLPGDVPTARKAEILREAARMKAQIIEEAKEAATVEANKVMEAAKVSIEQERKEAELQFRNEVSTFAIQIAEKLLREHMADEKAQSQLVDKLLDEIETKN